MTSTNPLPTTSSANFGHTGLKPTLATQPSHWKTDWARRLKQQCPYNRLPRGFSHLLHQQIASADKSVVEPPSWIAQNQAAISAAVQKLGPAAPVKKSPRSKAKPST